MNRYTGRGPAFVAALLHLAHRPLRLVLAASLAGLLLAAFEFAGYAALRGVTPGALASPRAIVTVLMPVGAGSPESAHVRDVMSQAEGVESLHLLPRDLALAELAKRPALAGMGVAGINPNPLPDAWVASFLPTASAQTVEAAVTQWARDPWVGTVEYDPAPWRRWIAVRSLVRAIAIAVAAALLVAGLFAFASCIGFGPRASPEEARVLLELGASRRSLRRPFVYAGALAGLLAGLAAWLFVGLAWRMLSPLVEDFVAQFALASPWLEVPAWFGAAGSIALGALAAMMAALAARFSGNVR